MCRAVAHRGPDAEGVRVFAPHPSTGVSAGLGHRRLAVLDPSPAGMQPMANARQDVHIVFNGEIFNFQAIRERLESRGHQFRTGTDTEVLLALYDERGADALHELNGMFAFLLWDQRTGRALMARDRFGVKPLYYCERNGEVLVASEVQGIVAGLGVSPELDPEAVDLFLTLRYVPAPWTIYEGIRKLPAGHVLIVDRAGVRETPWYELPISSEKDLLTAAEARAELRHLLDDAVKLRMISDRPLGSFLSGGLDSSIITALAARHVTGKLETFSITFPGEGMFDESPYSRAVARHVGTDHHEIPLQPRDVLDAIPTVLDSQDEPFADAAAVPTWLMSYHARKSIVVALSGDGADEIFAGYRKYMNVLYNAFFAALPGTMRRGVIASMTGRIPRSGGSAWLERARSLQRFFEGTDTDPSSHMLRLMSVFQPADVALLKRPEAPLGFARDALLPGIRERLAAAGGLVNGALSVDVHLALPDQMLVKMDRMSMRHGLEVRTPFLDVRVVELAFRVRGGDKLWLGQGKKIVLDTFRELLPPEIYKRPKRGFEMPLGSWFRGPLEAFVRDELASETARHQPWLDPEALDAMFDEHRSGRQDHTYRLWSVLCLFRWMRRNAAVH